MPDESVADGDDELNDDPATLASRVFDRRLFADLPTSDDPETDPAVLAARVRRY